MTQRGLKYKTYRAVDKKFGKENENTRDDFKHADRYSEVMDPQGLPSSTGGVVNEFC